MEVFDHLEAIFERAKKYRMENNREGPDGHLLRDIRGSIDHYMEVLEKIDAEKKKR